MGGGRSERREEEELEYAKVDSIDTTRRGTQRGNKTQSTVRPSPSCKGTMRAPEGGPGPQGKGEKSRS